MTKAAREGRLLRMQLAGLLGFELKLRITPPVGITPTLHPGREARKSLSEVRDEHVSFVSILRQHVARQDALDDLLFFGDRDVGAAGICLPYLVVYGHRIRGVVLRGD